MANKEIITENELLELANRYIQLEQEFEEYVTAAHEIIDDLEKKLSIANKFIASQKEYYENLNQLKTK